MAKEKPKEETKENVQEFVDELVDIDIEQLIPPMQTEDAVEQLPEESIVKDEVILDLYGEILENCRNDRKEVNDILDNFVDMVINNGDASSASKEAIVNLFKVKSDTSDKMSKVADLMTRIKLKEKDTFPRYLAQQQNNKVVIEGNSNKRELIKSIDKMQQNHKLNKRKENE